MPKFRFDPPAFMTDFDRIEGQREAWHRFVSLCFHTEIETLRGTIGSRGVVQYFSADDGDQGPMIEQAITWNAFPKEALRQYGREQALMLADRVQWTEGDTPVPLRLPMTEYCEWHVVRNPDTNKIVTVTFTSEPFEYWAAMFGESVAEQTGNKHVKFPGDPDLVLKRYRDLVGPQVQRRDLVAKKRLDTPYGVIAKNHYNPFNKWNTTHGIVHLTSPPNTLGAEIALGGDATLLYRNARGDLLVEPDPLICCAGYGGPNRNSDPTIGGAVNALARAGAMVTLANPVGLYMDHIDLSGWAAPPGINIADCVRVVRGDARRRLIERLVVEVPAGHDAVVGDLTIGGEPIQYGGQIAECITVKLVGAAAKLGTVQNVAHRCTSRCCIDPANATMLGDPVPLRSATPPGTVTAFAVSRAAPGAPPAPHRGNGRARERRGERRRI